MKYLLLFLLILAGTVVLVVFNSGTQTVAVNTYLSSLSKTLNTKISLRKAEVSFFDEVNLYDLYIEDLHGDTLLYSKQLKVAIQEFSLSDKVIAISSVKGYDTYFNLRHYKEDSTSNMYFLLQHFKPKKKSKTKWDFSIGEVQMRKTRFDYNHDDFVKHPAGIDYKHVGISYLDVAISEIELIPKGVACKINYMKFFEQSGFQMDRFETKFKISPEGIVAQELIAQTPLSSIDGNVEFKTEDYKDLKDFIHLVKIQSNFNETKVDFKDICFFAPAVDCLNKSIVFKGEVKGEISNLKARKFSFISDDGTRFRGKFDLTGLPEAENMFMYVDVKELITTKAKLESIPLYPFQAENFIQLPDNFRQLGTIRFKGNLTGFYHDFVTYGTIKTSLGNVKTDLSLKMKNGQSYYKGDVKTTNFHLGRFFDISNGVGDITMNVKLDGSGFSKEDIDVTMTGNIAEFVFKDYEYNNMEVKGNFQNEVFSGYLAAEDENFGFDFDGTIDLSKKIPEYKFISNVRKAKLAKLNLVDSRKKLKTRFTTTVLVDLTGDHIDNLVGTVELKNTLYEDKLDTIFLESVFVDSHIENKIHDINIKSAFLDGNIKGEFYAKELTPFVENFFVRYIPSQIDEQHKIYNLSHNLDFGIEIHNSDLLAKFFFKGVDMSDHTLLEGHYNSTEHVLSIEGISPILHVNGVELDKFHFEAKADEEVFEMYLESDNIIFNSDSLYVKDFRINSKIEKDSVLTKMLWDNRGSVDNRGDFTIHTKFNGFDHVSNKFIDSYAYLGGDLWKISPNNKIDLDTNALFIQALNFSTGDQSILVDGKLSNDSTDQVDLLLKNFDLNNLKKVVPSDVVKVEGIVDGVASINKKQGDLLYTTDLQFKELRINESLMGEGSLEALWNSASQSLNIDGKFYRGVTPTISFGGFYYPNKLEESLDLTFELYQTELNMFDEYIKESVSELSGIANAKVDLTGNFSKPKLNGAITLQNTSFKINYLNTSYHTSFCQINIAPDMISFDNVKILDQGLINYAMANGTVYHEWFKDWSIDIGLDVHNLLALNTTENDNSLYHGKAYVSGFVNVGSYDKNMIVDVQVKTEKNTVLNIPLNNSEEIVENNFIEFVSRDSSEIQVDLEEEVDLTNLEMNFELEATPDAEVRLVFDDQIGDVMRSRGSGNITLNVNNDGDLNMFGKYTVKDGDYLFTLQNVINKRFDLEEGGTISWNGSPYDAEINLTAVYRLRARLYDLLLNIDTSDAYKKRIPVDLKLVMKNDMMNPDIGFDIVLPTADEDTKNKVKSVLYVSGKEENIQELNKQVFSLLVLNSFLPPPGATAGYGHASVQSTTSSELLSNQLSNWLSKISNDFDVGVNYRPGDELSGQELELALSTQLLNDRLVLDGNFGVSEGGNVSSQAQNTNNFFGSVEYKISKDGKLRAKYFYDSNQYSLQNANSTFSTGIGLSFKEEYDTGKEFWKKLADRFKKKKKKGKGQ